MEENIFSIQKCFLSKAHVKCFAKEYKLSNFVLVKHPIIPNEAHVCKLKLCSDIHPSFCHVDASVIHRSTEKPAIDFDSLPHAPIPLAGNHVKILPAVVYVPSVFVTVIIKNVEDLLQFKSAKNIVFVQRELREILQLYTLTNSCRVDLKNLGDIQKFGINSILVHGFENNDPHENIFVGRITTNTQINIVDFISKAKYDRMQKCSATTSLGGLSDPYESLQDIIISSKQYWDHDGKPQQLSQHVLLLGPPGCGKTSLVRQVASNCDAALVEVLGPEVCCPLPGDTEKKLRAKFNEAIQLASEGLCVLLLDEVDSLCPERNNAGTSSHLVRVTAQLLALLEQADSVPGLVVVATTNRPYALDATLRRHGRLAFEIHIGIPNAGEREQILEVLLASLDAPSGAGISRQVARWTPGYVGADLALICQDVALRRHRRGKTPSLTVSHRDDWLSDFHSAVGNVRPSLLRGGLGVVAGRPVSLAKIGGLKNVKQSLKAAVEWPLLHPEAFARMGLPQPKGVLLYGPPGCAKTTIAQAVAAENNTTFLSVSAAELYSPFVGDAEKNVSELFHRARQGAPSVIFIDEIDALAGTRGERDKGVQERVLSALLTEMDGIGVRLDDSVDSSRLIREGESDVPGTKVRKVPVSNRAVIVIAATNRPDMLDPALVRPGRFDRLVYVPAPNAADRADILTAVTATMPLDADVDIPSIAEATQFYSGADLVNLMKEAGLCALTKDGMDVAAIRSEHILQAISITKPSLTQEQINWYINYNRG